MHVDLLAQVRAHVAAHLESHGWSMLGGVAIARKAFETAVGPKDAHAYLGQLRTDGTSFLLTGDYWSEGRNVLGPAITLIPRNASGDAIKMCVDQFAAKVESFVGQSYAVKLHRSSLRDADASPSTAPQQAH